MKRFFALSLALVLIIPSFSVASAPSFRFSAYGNCSDTDGLFKGDGFALDLFMSPDDLSATIILTIWECSDVITKTKQARVRTKTTDNLLYFVFADDSYYTAHYDEKYSYMIWLDIDGYSVRLSLAEDFNPVSGFVKP